MSTKLGEFHFGVLRDADLDFHGDSENAEGYAEAIRVMESIGGTPVAIDFSPFAEARELLYEGPWIAERSLVMDGIVAKHADEIFPVTRQILSKASDFSAKDAFRAIHRIAELKRDVRRYWQDIDVLLVPTTPTTYTRQAIAEDPIDLNTRLGTYTNFVNLMTMSGCAVPSGFRSNATAYGMTILGDSFHDGKVLQAARRYHLRRAQTGLPLGASGCPHPSLFG